MTALRKLRFVLNYARTLFAMTLRGSDLTDEKQYLRILLLRHGESQHNLDGSGGLDSGLTERGMEQARCVAPYLARHFQIAALYSSTLNRARQTAEILAPALNLPIQFRDDLREADYEIGEDMPRFASPAAALGAANLAPETRSERYLQFQQRVVAAFRDLVRGRDTGTLLVVTHGGVIATLLRSVFAGHQVSIYVDNTALVMLQWRDERWYLEFSNRREHLLD